MRIGFLGFGEAASHIATGFSKQEDVEIFAYDVALNSEGERRDILQGRLDKAGAVPVQGIKDLADKANYIFLIIPPKFAQSAAMELLPYLTEEHLLCDMTSNRPEVKMDLAKNYMEHNALYVDAAVMGAVPIYQHKTPTLVCGTGAEKLVELMTPLGMELTNVGEEAGKAIKMKLTRSIFVKGIEALTMETLMAARSLGIEEEIIEGIDASFRNLGFKKFCGQLVTSGVEHAGRRSQEAKECQELVETLGLDSTMAEATYRKLQYADSLGYARMEPMPKVKDFEELCQLWESTGVICRNNQ